MSWWTEWIFGTYKINVLTSLWLLLLCMIFFFLPELILWFFLNLIFWIIGSHIVFISAYADSLKHLIIQYFSLSSISTLSNKGRWFLFSFHIWSAIPDFSISPHSNAFRHSSSLTFTTCLAFAYFITAARCGVCTVLGPVEILLGDLTWKRYFQRVNPLVNTVLMSYEPYIFWIFSARPLT